MFFLIMNIVLYSLSSDHLHNTKYVIGGLVLCQEIFRFYSLWSSLELQHFPVQELWLQSKKKLDLLGIVVLGVITAVGGRNDASVLLGIHPPTLFLKPVYVTVAVSAAIIIFLLMRSKNISRFLLTAEYYDWTMNLLDAIGLGAFYCSWCQYFHLCRTGEFSVLNHFPRCDYRSRRRSSAGYDGMRSTSNPAQACICLCLNCRSGFLRIHRQPYLSGHGTDSQCSPGSCNPSARQTLRVESPKMQYESFKLTIQ